MSPKDNTCNQYDMKTNGFTYLPNVFTPKSIKLLKRRFDNFNFEKQMHFQICHFDCINQSFHDVPNSVSLSQSIADFVRGENYLVNSKSRTVHQLYSEGGCGIYRFKVPEAYTPDGRFQVAYRYDEDDITYINRFYLQNKQMIDNLIFTNSHLYKYVHDHDQFFSKLFINKPGCQDQELHADLLNEYYMNDIILLIPLNDSYEQMGTTEMLDDAFLHKHSVDKNNKNKLIEVQSLLDDSIEKPNHVQEIIRQDLNKSKFRVYFKLGDAILLKNSTIHRGTKNISSNDRIFIHVSLRKPPLKIA